ncbi:MAG: GHMP kinase [Gammaproteobacteria bacterium]|nr:GHMP kinase [Gammaproteobacteria bacterium]
MSFVASNLPHSVTVCANARLHLGFLDLNGGFGRHFGSLGLSLESPRIEINLQAADKISATGPVSDRAKQFAQTLLHDFKPGSGVAMQLTNEIPTHAGLGSGTQLALAVGRGLSELYDLNIPHSDIALKLERGARSGIGIGAFEQGGFLVDGGHTKTNSLPPIIARMDFPEQWRIILIQDCACEGLHGQAEKDAFAQLPPVSETQVGAMCRSLVMRVLPSLAEQDITEFGNAITQIQNSVGDHFAPAQGGRYYSPTVAESLNWMLQNGAAGVGQSSWGPTGFALCESENDASILVNKIRKNVRNENSITYQIVEAKNCGSDVHVERALHQAASTG